VHLHAFKVRSLEKKKPNLRPAKEDMYLEDLSVLLKIKASAKNPNPKRRAKISASMTEA